MILTAIMGAEPSICSSGRSRHAPISAWVVLSGALDDASRGLAAVHDAGGLTMVLTPGRSPERGMPENAISYDGPIDLIGDPLQIAEGICAACRSQKS